jgi:hypothetical protein
MIIANQKALVYMPSSVITSRAMLLSVDVSTDKSLSTSTKPLAAV